MHRRTALAVCGASLASLAGCSDADDPSPSTDTPTDTRTAPADPAAFEFVGVDAPAEVGVATPYEFDARVRNTASETRRFASTLSLRVEGGEWHTFEEEVSTEVDPDSVGTVGASLGVLPYLNNYEVRLDALDATWTVRTVPERLAFGEAYTTPRGISLAVMGGRFEETYGTGGNQTATTPEPGNRWVIVLLELRNTTGSDKQTPALGSFVLTVGDDRYPTRLADPRRRVDVGAGTTTRLELPYVVPEETTAENLSVEWRQQYNQGTAAVVWEGGGGSS